MENLRFNKKKRVDARVVNCYSLKNKHYERYLEITTFFIQIISMYAVAVRFLILFFFFSVC